jgi:hypothetical protein
MSGWRTDDYGLAPRRVTIPQGQPQDISGYPAGSLPQGAG